MDDYGSGCSQWGLSTRYKELGTWVDLGIISDSCMKWTVHGTCQTLGVFLNEVR